MPKGADVVAEGFSFMTHKAGGDADDAELAAWWNAVKGQRGQLLLGAYWVLYPGSPTGRAKAFLARLDSQCPGWRDGPFMLQLDCEIWNGDKGTQPGKSDIQAACGYLAHVMPKLNPIVYASQGQYGNTLSGLGYPLWNARYPTSAAGAASTIYRNLGGDTGSGWAAYSGQTPAIWQFTSSAVIAGQTTSDANAYRGTLQQLTALVAPGWEDDVTTQSDLTAALTAFFASSYQDPTTKKILTSRVGEQALNQGIPNAFQANAKTTTWGLLGDMAKALIAQATELDALKVQLAALGEAQTTIPQAQLDLAMLNALKTLAGGQA